MGTGNQEVPPGSLDATKRCQHELIAEQEKYNTMMRAAKQEASATLEATLEATTREAHGKTAVVQASLHASLDVMKQEANKTQAFLQASLEAAQKELRQLKPTAKEKVTLLKTQIQVLQQAINISAQPAQASVHDTGHGSS